MKKFKVVATQWEHYFGHCGNEGHDSLWMNVGKTNWIACQKCGIRWLDGSGGNGWRDETEATWEKNAKALSQMTEVADDEFLVIPDGLNVLKESSTAKTF